MSLKSQIEAIIYAAEEPVTLEQMLAALKDDLKAMQSAENPGAEFDLTRAKALLNATVEELAAEYAVGDRGMEIRQVAGGYRMSTKPEHHDVVRAFARSLKPPIRLSLPALETLAVIAYKQPVTVPEINEIRSVDSSGVIATLLDRKLITTAGRKQVVGRPILYRTTKDFLMRFGLGDISELPSVEEFEKLAAASLQGDIFPTAVPDATGTANETPAPASDKDPQNSAEETATGATVEFSIEDPAEVASS